MNKKPKLIIFEGVDGVGKTTVYQAFRKVTNYCPLCIDRFIGSNFAYDTFFKRNNSPQNLSTEDLFALEDKLKDIFDCILVYLVCGEKILRKRIVEHNKEELDKEPIKRIKEVDSLFHNYYMMSGFKKVIIDTSYRNVGEVVDIITWFMLDPDVLDADFDDIN